MILWLDGEKENTNLNKLLDGYGSSINLSSGCGWVLGVKRVQVYQVVRLFKKKRDYVDLSDLKLVGSNNDLYYNY